MKKIDKVVIGNFRSFGIPETEYSFDSNELVLFSGNNGAGKTTILTAINFVLFGQYKKGINLDRLINKVNKKNMFGRVYFDSEYYIERTRKPTTVKIFKLNKNSNEYEELPMTTRDAQAHIDELIGRSSELFNSLILFTKDNLNFMEMNPTEKRAYKNSVLGMDWIDSDLS